MKVTTDTLHITLNECKSDVFYWEQKMQNTNDFKRRNYYRTKADLAKDLLKETQVKIEAQTFTQSN